MSVRTIAKRLNISASTVSLALRGSCKISADTRVRVKKEAELIGYVGDAKLREVMSQMRSSAARPTEACLGLLSFGQASSSIASQKRSRAVCLWLASRAEKLGYRLERFSLKEMSPARLRVVLEARGIEGLICFSDDCLDDSVPEELSGFSLVSIGGSLGGKVDCVLPDYFFDLEQSFKRLVELGYGRVGLVLGDGLEADAASRYLGAFLSQQSASWMAPWMTFSSEDPGSQASLESWLVRERPDALLCAGIASQHIDDALDGLPHLDSCQVAFLDLEDAAGQGICLDIEEIGCRAVDLLVRNICQARRAFDAKPHIELVRSCWGAGLAAVPSIAEADLCRLGASRSI